jgi:hypothetical protein
MVIVLLAMVLLAIVLLAIGSKTRELPAKAKKTFRKSTNKENQKG